jgi:anthranilate synthase component 1
MLESRRVANGNSGTVSGAPKVRAMELIAELEREKRGVYAGAVGYFGYGTVDGDKLMEGAMDVSCK